MKRSVLILCTGNSARSQMAEGLLRHDAGETFDVESAGTKPSIVRPEAIAVMQELGVSAILPPLKDPNRNASRHFAPCGMNCAPTFDHSRKIRLPYRQSF